MNKFEIWFMFLLFFCVAMAIGFLGWEFYRYNNLKEAELHFGWGRQKVQNELDHITGKENKQVLMTIPPKYSETE